MLVRFYDREDGDNPQNGWQWDSAEGLLWIADGHSDRAPFFAALVAAALRRTWSR